MDTVSRILSNLSFRYDLSNYTHAHVGRSNLDQKLFWWSKTYFWFTYEDKSIYCHRRQCKYWAKEIYKFNWFCHNAGNFKMFQVA